MKPLLAILILLTVAGCVYTSYTNPNGTKVKQWGPKGQSLGWVSGTPADGDKPATPESLTAGQTPRSQNDYQSARADKVLYIGIAFLLAAVAAAVLSNWILKPLMLPTTVWSVPGVIGLVLILASFALPIIPWWGWALILCVAVGLVVVPGWLANHWPAIKAKANPADEGV